MHEGAAPSLHRRVVASHGRPVWAVGFRIPRLRDIVDDAAVAAMFGLPTSAVADLEMVILTSSGTEVLRRGAPTGDATTLGAAQDDPVTSLLDGLDPSDADCVGIARGGTHGPVAMSAWVDGDGAGRAEAILPVVPAGLNALAPLLAGVGVRVREVARRGDGALVRFGFDLSRHVQSARLAQFGRTTSCVEFFRLACAGAGTVEPGLRRALLARVADGADRVRTLAIDAARPEAPIAMRPYSPGRPPADACGDIVPLGVLRAGLRALPPEPSREQIEACADLRTRLLSSQREGRWGFGTDMLPTAADSALVLLGLRDREAIALLARDRAGDGGILPQRTSDVGHPATMDRRPETAHWEQPDLVTTCLTRHLCAATQVAEAPPLDWITRRLDARSGLFVASPWLVDLAVALALGTDPAAGPARTRLRDDLLAARGPDGAFGRDDERPLATAAATCALGELGVRGRVLAESQLRLVEALEDEGRLRRQVPFYSTLRAVTPAHAAGLTRELLRGPGAAIVVGGEPHALTLYEDSGGAVTLGLACLALARQAGVDDDTHLLEGLPPSAPRYRAADVAAYVAEHALPPYVAERRSALEAHRRSDAGDGGAA